MDAGLVDMAASLQLQVEEFVPIAVRHSYDARGPAELSVKRGSDVFVIGACGREVQDGC
jgi:hypothetical protein